MDEVFIRTWTLPEWLGRKYFKDKDFYSIDELVSIIEDLDSEAEDWKEKYEDLEKDLQENYRPITQREMIDYDEKTW